ncbi:hypothetical protein [Bacillus velezensis]|uniref:hypothetical protein n=1 Tax=Bacillus velezensis TaxID=492670 RepID=UPI003F7B4F8D
MTRGNINTSVWKYLIERLTDDEKKTMLKKKNVVIGSIQTKLITTEMHWKVVLFRLNSDVQNNIKIQRILLDYYIEKQAPDLKRDIKNQAEHLECFKNSHPDEFKSLIDKHGFIYFLLYLLVIRDVEKVNKLFNLKPNEVGKNTAENKTENKELLQIKKLQNEVNLLSKANRKIEKKYTLFEKKQNELIIKKNREIEKVKNKYEDRIESYINSIREQKKEFEDLISKLEMENQELSILLEEEKKKKKQLNEILLKDLTNSKTSNYKKDKKLRVLVFGDLPITMKKEKKYDFTIYNKDISTYTISDECDEYDEYWCIEDKLSQKEKRQLKQSNDSSKIKLKKYCDLVN